MNGSASKANRAGVTLPCYPCDAMPSQAGPGRAWPNDAERSRTVCGRQNTGGVPCRTDRAVTYRATPKCAVPRRRRAAPCLVISTLPDERAPVGRNDTVRNRLSHHAPVPVVGPQDVAAATEYP